MRTTVTLDPDVEALVKAIRDQVAESAAPKADEPLRFAVVAAGRGQRPGWSPNAAAASVDSIIDV